MGELKIPIWPTCRVTSHEHATKIEVDACRAERDRCVAICDAMLIAAANTASDKWSVSLVRELKRMIIEGDLSNDT